MVTIVLKLDAIVEFVKPLGMVEKQLEDQICFSSYESS